MPLSRTERFIRRTNYMHIRYTVERIGALMVPSAERNNDRLWMRRIGRMARMVYRETIERRASSPGGAELNL